VLEAVHEAVLTSREYPAKDVSIVSYLDRNLVTGTVRPSADAARGHDPGQIVLSAFLGSPAGPDREPHDPLSLLFAFILMHHFNIPANCCS